jgi:hypothetical protein
MPIRFPESTCNPGVSSIHLPAMNLASEQGVLICLRQASQFVRDVVDFLHDTASVSFDVPTEPHTRADI